MGNASTLSIITHSPSLQNMSRHQITLPWSSWHTIGWASFASWKIWKCETFMGAPFPQSIITRCHWPQKHPQAGILHKISSHSSLTRRFSEFPRLSQIEESLSPLKWFIADVQFKINILMYLAFRVKILKKYISWERHLSTLWVWHV